MAGKPAKLEPSGICKDGTKKSPVGYTIYRLSHQYQNTSDLDFGNLFTSKFQVKSCLVAHPRIFRLFMKEKFDAYVRTVTLGQKGPKLNNCPVYCLW